MEQIEMTGEMLVFVVVFITALLYFGGKIGSKSLDSAFAEEEV
jgi:uncharacterized membrane protein